MPEQFIEYITDKLKPLGWQQSATSSSSLFASIRFRPGNTMSPFSAIYLKRRIDTDGLLYLFQNITDHLLIVVDSDLMGDEVGNKEWFRALHALYYGRVYVWDGVGILPVHYDRKNGQFSNGGYIRLHSLRFERVDCLYGGFKGLYNVVLLNDRKFWDKAEKPPSRDTKTNPSEEFWRGQYAASDEAQQAGKRPGSEWTEARRKENERDEQRQKAKKDADDWRQARKDEHFRREQAQREEQRKRDEEARKAREREDVFRDFREAFERNKARYGAENGGAYDPNAQPHYARGDVTGDKWFMAIWSDGTKDGAKAAYKKLAREYHPDLNKAPDATAIMQLINRAYEKVMERHNG